MKRCRALDPQEVQLLLAALNRPEDRLLVQVLFYTGLRIREALSLKVGSIERGYLHISAAASKGGRHARQVALHPRLVDALSKHLEEHRLSGQSQARLFPGLTRHTAWAHISVAADRAGLWGVVGLHSFRRSFAQAVYSATDKDLAQTQMALGHRSVASTVKYLGIEKGRVDSVVMGLPALGSVQPN